MGTYTNVLKYYKTAENEVVDVEQQLNYNWNISDLQMRRLLEYEYTTAAAPNVVGALSRSRFYKEYSNSYMAYFSSGNFFYQDPAAYVSPWVDASSLITAAGWSSQPLLPLYYRIIQKTSGVVVTREVEWTGAVWIGGGPIAINVASVNLLTLPGSIAPAASKYFTVNCGNTAANYCIGRVFFGSSGVAQVKLYGQNPSAGSSSENRVDFGGIKYCLEVLP